MTSNDMPDFSSWQKWNSEAVYKAPNCPGVYAFRLAGSGFGRFKGKSDLVYVGCTESANGTISRRLSDHLPSRADASPTAHRLRDAKKLGELEVAWKTLITREEAIKEEAKLLRTYIWDHLELPPVNRSEPASEMRAAIEALTEYLQTTGQFNCHSFEDARKLAENVVEYLIDERHHEKRADTTPAAET